MSDDIYREIILDHNSNPRNYRKVESPTYQRRELNTSCGDDISVTLTMDSDGKVSDAAFQGNGCAITKATTSMLTEELIGKTAEEVAALDNDYIFELLGIELTGSRLRCGTLGLVAFRNSLTQE